MVYSFSLYKTCSRSINRQVRMIYLVFGCRSILCCKLSTKLRFIFCQVVDGKLVFGNRGVTYSAFDLIKTLHFCNYPAGGLRLFCQMLLWRYHNQVRRSHVFIIDCSRFISALFLIRISADFKLPYWTAYMRAFLLKRIWELTILGTFYNKLQSLTDI